MKTAQNQSKKVSLHCLYQALCVSLPIHQFNQFRAICQEETDTLLCSVFLLLKLFALNIFALFLLFLSCCACIVVYHLLIIHNNCEAYFT